MASFPIIHFSCSNVKIIMCIINSETHSITMYSIIRHSEVPLVLLYPVLQWGSIKWKDNYPTLEFSYSGAYYSIVWTSIGGFLSVLLLCWFPLQICGNSSIFLWTGAFWMGKINNVPFHTTFVFLFAFALSATANTYAMHITSWTIRHLLKIKLSVYKVWSDQQFVV